MEAVCGKQLLKRNLYLINRIRRELLWLAKMCVAWQLLAVNVKTGGSKEYRSSETFHGISDRASSVLQCCVCVGR